MHGNPGLAASSVFRLSTIKAARSIPATVSKHELWQDREDIFLSEQLRPKTGLTGSAAKFDASRPDLVADVLESSVLARAGLIEPEVIQARLEDKASAWLSSMVGTWLWRLVSLEIFLQGLPDLTWKALSDNR